MKKILCLLIGLMVLLSSLPALAEDFTIHEGVRFGDTRDTVKEKETLTLKRETPSNAKETYAKSVGEDIAVLEFQGTVAGYDKSYIFYYFDGDDNNSLFEARYHFPDYSVVGINGVIDTYKDLKKSLTNKYGEPLSDGDEISSLIISRKNKETLWANEYMKNNFSPALITQVDTDCWNVSCNGYNVKIELILEDNGKRVDIVYHYYTDDELETARAEHSITQQEKNDDL